MKVLIYWAMVFLEPVLVFLLKSNNPSKLRGSKLDMMMDLRATSLFHTRGFFHQMQMESLN